MIATVFLVLVLVALASIYSSLAMRIRLTRRLPLENGSWWMRGSGQVELAYKELFPQSYLPLIVRYAFWLVVAMAAAVMLIFRLRTG
jgi:hypothetical protein